MIEPIPEKKKWTGVKTAIITTIAAIAITATAVILYRLSDQALAVLAGAVCGVGAALPTALLIVAITRRREPEPQQPTQPVYTNPVLITPQLLQPPQPPAQPSIFDVPTPRTFTIVGGDDD